MDFVFRIAILALGYFYPAYKCFKAIDLGKPKSEQLHMWCQYWIIIAIFTGFERVADIFVSWLPFYSGVKLAFIVYLWHPDTKGTEYIYQTFVKPYLSEHAESMDQNLVVFRDESMRVLTILCNRLMYLVHLKVSGVLHEKGVPLPNTASRSAQDRLHLYAPISSSFYEGKSQQQQWSFSGHPSMVTQSAIWPREQYQQQPKAWSNLNLSQAGVDLPLGPQGQPAQLLSHHTWPLLPAAKPQNAMGEATKSPMLTSTVDTKKIGGKEEMDFELVHSNEIPAPEFSETLDHSKRNTRAQGARSRWWWWYQ